MEVGEFELKCNGNKYLEDVEEAGFAPSNIVGGLELSSDNMLEGGLLCYGDGERYRLGVKDWEIGVKEGKGVGIEKLCGFSGE
uniref:catalase n=1 Tax=Staphylococcus pasteuri TaxID=45972 RepID=UPI0012B85E83